MKGMAQASEFKFPPLPLRKRRCLTAGFDSRKQISQLFELFDRHAGAAHDRRRVENRFERSDDEEKHQSISAGDASLKRPKAPNTEDDGAQRKEKQDLPPTVCRGENREPSKREALYPP